MGSDVLDHGTPCGGCNQSVRDFETRVGEIVGGSPHNSASVFRPSIQLIGRLLQGLLLFFPGIGSSISPCPLMRLRGFFGEAEAAFSWAMLWRSASMILRTFWEPRHGALARDHDARLLLLEHFNDGLLVMVDEP